MLNNHTLWNQIFYANAKFGENILINGGDMAQTGI